MAAGFIDLFRKVWGWLAVDSGVVEEVGAQMCVAATGVYVPCSHAVADGFAVCFAVSANSQVMESTGDIWTPSAVAVGTHVHGLNSAKGFGCA